ncbi:hypothetical protein D8674_013480 [Pyrus ussuriensis x Pyrus communis]|uniref:Uncharacterized protein n=1 Tax=Pyrus ussuriensis x Pyrus communis TaxID=2448454 RepID=A0A5N5GUP3_9ROSA|nr:hypothetical protein D8674_013480 [Pyrus ussuriensis x Pyrus communis]
MGLSHGLGLNFFAHVELYKKNEFPFLTLISFAPFVVIFFKIECSLVERDFDKPGGLSDEGSPSSSSRFEPAISESLGSLLESCEEETLDDLHDHRTCILFLSLKAFDEGISEQCRSRDVTLEFSCLQAYIGSTFYVSGGEKVALDAIPIFHSEFIANHLDKNLLDSKEQLETLRQSCSIPSSVGMRLVCDEELSTKLPKGYVMFYTQILVTLGVKLPLHPWLQNVLSLIGYAPGQLNPGFWDTLVKFYIIWMECGLVEKVSKKRETSTKKWKIGTKKGKATMLVSVDDILFHKGARKHRVKPISRLRRGRRATVDEFDGPLAENESDRDWMMRLSAYMANGLAIGTFEFVGTRTTDANIFKCSTGTTASIPKASENGVSHVEVRYKIRCKTPQLVIDVQVADGLVSNFLSLDFIIWDGAMSKEFINRGDPTIPLLLIMKPKNLPEPTPGTLVRVQPHLVPPQDEEGFRQFGDVLVSMLTLD